MDLKYIYSCDPNRLVDVEAMKGIGKCSCQVCQPWNLALDPEHMQYLILQPEILIRRNWKPWLYRKSSGFGKFWWWSKSFHHLISALLLWNSFSWGQKIILRLVEKPFLKNYGQHNYQNVANMMALPGPWADHQKCKQHNCMKCRAPKKIIPTAKSLNCKQISTLSNRIKLTEPPSHMQKYCPSDSLHSTMIKSTNGQKKVRKRDLL